MNGRLRELAERTPSTRDRYVDFLRAFSIVTVVLGHWFIGINEWHNGIIRTTSAIGKTSWMWLATWVFQVMPLFFFVGGFSNLVTYDSFKRKGESTRAFLRTRAMRLIKPSAVFIGVWAVIQIVMHLADIGGTSDETSFLRGMLPPGATVPFGPLWFLPVYLFVIVLAPWTIKLHRRFGLAVPAVLVVAIAAVDVIAFAGGHPGVRYFNVAFVWLLPHQIGYFYADGRLAKMSKRGLALIAGAGLAAMVLLTNPPVFFGHGPEWFQGLRSFPKSMLGTDIEPIANTYPPTIVMVGMILWSIGVATLLRPFAAKWLQRTRPWMVTIYLNSVIMTLYLWHMTAYLLALLVLWPLGLGRQTDSTPSWWIQRPLFLIVPAIFLAILIVIFGRFERSVYQTTSTG
ncbi:MAG: acyltransferase [Actinomycetota bacterium]